MSDIENSGNDSTDNEADSKSHHVNTVVVIDMKSANGREFAKGIAFAMNAPGNYGMIANALNQCFTAENVGQYVAVSVRYRMDTTVPVRIDSFDNPNLREFLAKAIPAIGLLFEPSDRAPEIVLRVSTREEDLLVTALKKAVNFTYITRRAK